MFDRFINHIQHERRLSPHTIQAYSTDLKQFQAYLQAHHTHLPLEQVVPTVVRSWIMHLANQGLNNRSINRKLAALKAFYHYLTHQNHITQNPTDLLKSLKTPQRLPVFVREQELTQLLDAHRFPNTFEGARDQLILELLYGTGIRLSELLNLHLQNINTYDHTIRVLGKRNKERIVPYPKSLNAIMQQYQNHREQIPHQSNLLLLTSAGLPAYPMLIYKTVKKYLQAYTQADRYSPHVLRHTFATHLLNKGADLNAIKELLGHESLAATQLYTHNALEKLKEAFNQAHPRA